MNINHEIEASMAESKRNVAPKTDLMKVIETGINREVGNRIRDARQMADLNQGDLARRIGISASAVTQIENGVIMVKVCNLVMISQALNAPLPYFLEGVGKAVMSQPAQWMGAEDDGRRLMSILDVAKALAGIKDDLIRKTLRRMILDLADRISKMEAAIAAALGVSS